MARNGDLGNSKNLPKTARESANKSYFFNRLRPGGAFGEDGGKRFRALNTCSHERDNQVMVFEFVMRRSKQGKKLKSARMNFVKLKKV